GGDEGEWERRWREVEVAGQLPARDDADAPYRGLARFELADRELFFGRDDLIADVVELVGRRRFGALVGASGVGKSSLLRAGVIPALRHGPAAAGWLGAVRVLTPGKQPARTHAERLAVPSDGRDVLVVVDQFEEVFTLCQDPQERARFLDLLLTAAADDDDEGEDEDEDAHGGVRSGRLRVLLAVRADFFGRCAQH